MLICTVTKWKSSLLRQGMITSKLCIPWSVLHGTWQIWYIQNNNWFCKYFHFAELLVCFLLQEEHPLLLDGESQGELTERAKALNSKPLQLLTPQTSTNDSQSKSLPSPDSQLQVKTESQSEFKIPLDSQSQSQFDSQLTNASQTESQSQIYADSSSSIISVVK